MQFFTPRPAPPRDPAITVLLEETDPRLRLDAHLELGRRAMARRDAVAARTHFEEACDLDPTDERPRAELRGLARPTTKRGFLRFWRR
jgi:Tfp pilus assembly protein PilF